MTYSICMRKWEVVLALLQACNMPSYYMVQHGFGSMSSKRDLRTRVWAHRALPLSQGLRFPLVTACLSRHHFPAREVQEAQRNILLSHRGAWGRMGATCDLLPSPACGWGGCAEPPLPVPSAHVRGCPSRGSCLGG